MFQEKGAFSGWKDVFLFTFRQGTKGKGFYGTTFGIAILLFVGFLGVNVFMAYRSKEEVKVSPIESVYIQNESDLEGLDFGGYVSGMEEGRTKEFEGIRFEDVDDLKERLAETASANGKTVGLMVTEQDRQYRMELWIPENSDIEEKDGERLLDAMVGLLEQGKLLNSGIAIEKLAVVKAPVQTTFTNAGEDVESVGEMVAKMLVPMLCCFGVYMMLLLYGQSIGQIVVVEKTSKLMEMLLTTVKPYAVISGKILAMTVIAILQTLTWIVGGVLGFVVGDVIANGMVPEYSNVIKEVIGLIRDSSGGLAFTPLAVILALLVVFLGFFFYSVLAGLVASSISKAEDLANGMAIYQMVVIISFFATYFNSLNESNVKEGIALITPYIPFTAIFSLPGDLLVGSRGVVTGIIGLVIIMAATFVLIVITGKVYKDKVFHQGERIDSRLMRLFEKSFGKVNKR